jgi:hypothetical protein
VSPKLRGLSASLVVQPLAALIIILSLSASAWSAGPSGPGEAGQYPVNDVAPADEFAEPVPQAVPGTNFMSLYTGYTWLEDSNFYYIGGEAALNGDLSRPGFLVQAFGGLGDYEYPNSGVPGGVVSGDLYEVSGLLGYQFFAGNVKLAAFAGVDWQDNRLSPNDPSNSVSGSETDFITTASMETTGPKRLYLKLYGGYSIVNQTYWAKSRVAYKFGEGRRLKIGPEGAFYGNENSNNQQLGAFISIPLGQQFDVTLAGGYNFVANDEFFGQVGNAVATGSFGGIGGLTDGGYANVTLSTWF